MTIYFISIASFSVIILGLVTILAFIEYKVVNKADCNLTINDNSEKGIVVSAGTNLLTALSNESIFIPSACGGGGSCGMCKVKVLEGAGELLPTETPHLSRQERKDKVRLSCQLKVKENMSIKLPEEIFGIKKFECKVISNDNVATFIKELKLRMPESADLDFRAGGYIQIDIPAYNLSFSSFDIQDEYRNDWDQFKLWDLKVNSEEEIFRAYSMANYPEEKGVVYLNVRIATPPPRTQGVLPGLGSSYIFNLKEGDKVHVSGPYGEFFAKETDREMCFVGGGAGMAPMRSHIFDQLKRLKSKRPITFWYGARSVKEMFYDDEFKLLDLENSNFSYNVALSEPLKEDQWTGYKGFIHETLLNEYLITHDDPNEIEFYLCGPPIMIKCMQDMLFNLGVEPEMIAYDEFS